MIMRHLLSETPPGSAGVTLRFPVGRLPQLPIWPDSCLALAVDEPIGSEAPKAAGRASRRSATDGPATADFRAQVGAGSPKVRAGRDRRLASITEVVRRAALSLEK